ncbi:FAD-dependent oxidoreductase [Nocardia jejuensis]|uniref:FAD-dependent oxidoreductase n=1 Tax=Nocardia jejuensis TaxID=328049 RepID=UPI000831294D|nr:FAD-dependent oxidoreductase [Nocardia jejuensis]
MTPVWLIDVPTPARLPVMPDLRYDVVVVGAGLTGLVTALLLAEHGKHVAVLEAKRIGEGTTGASTAKISVLQGIRGQRIRRGHSRATLEAYLEANRAAQSWLVDYCEARGVAYQHADAFTYAQTARESKAVRAEYDVLREAGLPVQRLDEVDTPFPSFGAVRLRDQAQVNPMALLSMLAADIESNAVQIHESSAVRGVRSTDDGDHLLDTDRGPVRAGTVVLATGTPILDRGGFFARLRPERSYLTAYRTGEPIPHGMYISAGGPTRSLRRVPDPGGDLLLVGGNNHAVGRKGHTDELVSDLIGWTRRWFPDAEPIATWSAQDYVPIGELPYVGPMLPGREDILLGTGYAKWGMTNAVAAAHALAGRITGKTPDWAVPLSSWRANEIKALPAAAKTGAEVALELSTGWLRAARAGDDGSLPPEGTGRLDRRFLQPTATCTVDGTTTAVSAVCPHLRGIVRWNAAEKTWDCPLHGSRFAADGTLLEGPAGTGLAQVSPPIEPGHRR